MRWLSGLLVLTTVSAATAQSVPLSPLALAASSDGKTIYVACATGNRVLCFDTVGRKVSTSIPMPGSPSGLALSLDNTRLFVTCAAPESKVCVIDLKKKKTVETVPAGHTAMAPVLSPDGKTLYVCNRFNNNVSVIDLAARKEVRRIAVPREPVAADITKDGNFLLVANHLPAGRSDENYVAAVVSVIDLVANKVVKELKLPNGSGSLKDLRVSPNGKYAAVSHLVAQFKRPTTQVTYGWINENALTLIDLPDMEIHNTVLLDDVESGAANPWGLAWSADSTKLVVTHAGMHEVSVIDFPTIIPHVLSLRARDSSKTIDPNSAFAEQPDLADDLPFLAGGRQRVKLPKTDLGPRAVVIVGQLAYVANFFSDTLIVIDLDVTPCRAESIPLGPKVRLSGAREGEFYFNDATICAEGWQSCASCHPGDARADGLNWDLLNDGIGNPKNTKSLLLAHQTPPAMSLGVRDSAETAVRAGIQHILFTKQPEEVAAAIDEYLKSLKPVPSPYLVHGKLSGAARRGQKIFARAGCPTCHPPGLFTDLRSYGVSTSNLSDRPAPRLDEKAYSGPAPPDHKTFIRTDCRSCHSSDSPSNSSPAAKTPRDLPIKFDTPTLVELWRTAPYLHDGSAATVRDVVTTCNPHDQHGVTSNLSSQEIDDLCAYLLSL